MAKKIKLISIKKAADMLGVTRMTLRRWDASGKLKAVRVGTRTNQDGKTIGDRRYYEEDIKKMIKKG